MTRPSKKGEIDVKETVATVLRDACRALSERMSREIRYDPDFHGEISVTVIFQRGVPRGFKEHSHETTLVEPIID